MPVWLLWMSDQLVAETSTWQHTQHSQQTNIHDPGEILNHDLSRRKADVSLGPRGHWDRRSLVLENKNNNNNDNNNNNNFIKI